MSSAQKFKSATLPTTRDEAVKMADAAHGSRAADARNHDLHGSAKEWELTAQLLRVFAVTLRA